MLISQQLIAKTYLVRNVCKRVVSLPVLKKLDIHELLNLNTTVVQMRKPARNIIYTISRLSPHVSIHHSR